MNKKRLFCLFVSVICLFLGVFLSVKSQTIVQRSISISTYEKMKSDQQTFTVYVKKNSCPDCKIYDKKLEKHTYLSFFGQQKILYVIDLEHESDSNQIRNFVSKNELIEVPALLNINQNDSHLQGIDSIF